MQQEDCRVLGLDVAPARLRATELVNLAPVVASMPLELQTTDSLPELETVPAKSKAMAKPLTVSILEQTRADSSASLGSESQAKGTSKGT
jgi:hypothetical protein